MDRGSPPPEVETLYEDVGVWRAQIEVRPAEGAPVQLSHGRLTSRMCGPWLVSDFKNETNGFEGHGIYGWDSIERHYVGTWVDPMRRGMLLMRGVLDPETRTLTFVAEIVRPDGGHIRWREVTERPKDDVRIFRSFVPTSDGREHEVMTVRYERERSEGALPDA